MVKALVNISEHTNRVLNVVKAKWDLRDKSDAINLVTEMFEEEVLDPELRPELVAKLKRAERQKAIKVSDIDRFLGLK